MKTGHASISARAADLRMWVNRNSKGVSLLSTLLGLAGSAVATMGGTSLCESCEAPNSLGTEIPFSKIGIVAYSAIAGALFVGRRLPLAATALSFAAGAHLSLVLSMITASTFCWVCGATAGTIILAASVASFAFLKDIRLFLLAMFCGAMSVQILFVGEDLLRPKREISNATAAINKALSPGEMDSDQVLLVVLFRDGCPPCAEFQDRDIPALVDRCGFPVRIKLVSAPDNVPTPTIAVFPGTDQVFIGRPHIEDLLKSVHAAHHTLTSAQETR